MRKQGLTVWEKFFDNLRSSCITDKERLAGWTDSVLNAVFGNSKIIRQRHYIQPLQDAAFALLGQQNKNKQNNNNNDIGSNTPEQRFNEIENSIQSAVISNMGSIVEGNSPMQNSMYEENNVQSLMSIPIDSEFYEDHKITAMDIFVLSGIDEEYQNDCLRFIKENEFCIKILKDINYLYGKYCEVYSCDYSKRLTVDFYVNVMKKQIRYFAEWVKNRDNFFIETYGYKEVKDAIYEIESLRFWI
jgi:hypothetical protein